MSLVRWDPFREYEDFFSRMMPSVGRSARGGEAGALDWSPSADISETDGEYLIRAELPAVRKEDVKVTVHDGRIQIEGERKYEHKEKGERFHRVESFQGRFARAFSLPKDADVEHVSAESRDGVLTVKVPKAKQAQPKPIEVRVG